MEYCANVNYELLSERPSQYIHNCGTLIITIFWLVSVYIVIKTVNFFLWGSEEGVVRA